MPYGTLAKAMKLETLYIPRYHYCVRVPHIRKVCKHFLEWKGVKGGGNAILNRLQVWLRGLVPLQLLCTVF